MARKVIMIVDDDDFMRDFFADALQSPERDIVQAKNGKEAADKLEELVQADNLPYAVLTDFEMPNMNGLELLKFIRNHSDPRIKNLRVVMVSGNCSRRLHDWTAELDCRLLEKPVHFAELCSALFRS